MGKGEMNLPLQGRKSLAENALKWWTQRQEFDHPNSLARIHKERSLSGLE